MTNTPTWAHSPTLACAVLLGGLLLPAGSPLAATLTVSVVDRTGAPVADAVAYAVPEKSAPSPQPANAVMDQIDRQFKPGVLVVEAGSAVAFPNSDSVSHHVYSFSKAKRFELPLYRGTAHPPVLFDTPGVVVVGCNIHDSMLGYIVVVDSPYFASATTDGQINLSGLPAGDYAVHVWTPRARASLQPKMIRMTPTEGVELTFQFSQKLLPTNKQNGGSLAWSDY